MCVWSVAHALCGVAYVACGACQLVAATFLFVAAPELRLSGYICAGALNVVVGIAAGMSACLARQTQRRREWRLYAAVSVIAANAVVAALTEWCLYAVDAVDAAAYLASQPDRTLTGHAVLAARLATGAALAASFADSQLAFCSLQGKGKGTSRLLDNVPDIEYVIPRAKPPKQPGAHAAHAQSWVFEGEESPPPPSRRPEIERARYASLLQKAVGNSEKRTPSPPPPPPPPIVDEDADFTRELEAALRLIQDLESPPAAVAAATAPPPETGGRRHDRSQSTSGYDGSPPLRFATPPPGGRSRSAGPSPTGGGGRPWRGAPEGGQRVVRSLLRPKRRSGSAASTCRLSPELEAAIVRSESLAHLSDAELRARHRRNVEDLERRIGQRALRQAASTYSFGSSA